MSKNFVKVLSTRIFLVFINYYNERFQNIDKH